LGVPFVHLDVPRVIEGVWWSVLACFDTLCSPEGVEVVWSSLSALEVQKAHTCLGEGTPIIQTALGFYH